MPNALFSSNNPRYVAPNQMVHAQPQLGGDLLQDRFGVDLSFRRRHDFHLDKLPHFRDVVQTNFQGEALPGETEDPAFLVDDRHGPIAKTDQQTAHVVRGGRPLGHGHLDLLFAS